MIWLSLIVIVIGGYLIYPEFFTKDNFTTWLGYNSGLIRIVYIVMICIRALFFVPSTVLLLLGIALFPEEPLFVIVINLLGILIGAWLLYKAAQYFTPEVMFSEKKQQKLNTVKDRMNQYGFGIVLVWSFIPIVPTDLICYVAGVVKMNAVKFYSAVFIGELILVSIYVYTGNGIMELLG